MKPVDPKHLDDLRALLVQALRLERLRRLGTRLMYFAGWALPAAGVGMLISWLGRGFVTTTGTPGTPPQFSLCDIPFIAGGAAVVLALPLMLIGIPIRAIAARKLDALMASHAPLPPSPLPTIGELIGRHRVTACSPEGLTLRRPGARAVGAIRLLIAMLFMTYGATGIWGMLSANSAIMWIRASSITSIGLGGAAWACRRRAAMWSALHTDSGTALDIRHVRLFVYVSETRLSTSQLSGFVLRKGSAPVIEQTVLCVRPHGAIDIPLLDIGQGPFAMWQARRVVRALNATLQPPETLKLLDKRSDSDL